MTVNTKEDAFLWVEGDDDQQVIWELRDQSGLERNFAVKSANGSAVLLRAFIDELEADNRRVEGIVIDANGDRNGRWQSITDRIKRTNLNYVLPPEPDPNGTIIEPPDAYRPRIGIWIMPDNQANGALEDFIRECIADSDRLVPYAKKILDEIEAQKLHHYKDKRNKAFIHTWLAWQEEPGRPIRTSFQKGTLLANAPIAQTFVNWLDRLFNA